MAVCWAEAGPGDQEGWSLFLAPSKFSHVASVFQRDGQAWQSSVYLMLPVSSRLGPHMTLRWQTRSRVTPPWPIVSAEFVPLTPAHSKAGAGAVTVKLPSPFL